MNAEDHPKSYHDHCHHHRHHRHPPNAHRSPPRMHRWPIGLVYIFDQLWSYIVYKVVGNKVGKYLKYFTGGLIYQKKYLANIIIN